MDFKSWINLQEIGFPIPGDYKPHSILPTWQSDRKQRLGINPEGIGETGVEQVVNRIIKRAEELFYERKTGRYTIPKTPLFLIGNLIKKFTINPNYQKQFISMFTSGNVAQNEYEEIINSLKAYLDEIEEKYINYPRVMNMQDNPQSRDWIDSQYDEDYLEFLKSHGFLLPPPKSHWGFVK